LIQAQEKARLTSGFFFGKRIDPVSREGNAGAEAEQAAQGQELRAKGRFLAARAKHLRLHFVYQ
jgi:hypothetical protein